MDETVYDADYFLEGEKTKKSLFTNYRWLPALTIPMASRIAEVLCLSKSDKILDYGCARGYLVRAFRELGYEAYGYDISDWAITNCDESARPWLYKDIYAGPLVEWVVAKDVLEHIPDVAETINGLGAFATKGVFAVVPTSAIDGWPYVISDYEKDSTHVIRWTLSTWINAFRTSLGKGWIVLGVHRIAGIKDNWYKPCWKKGNGFIVARRIT